MNKCFLMGKIQTEVDFKFIINGSHDSLATFLIGLPKKNNLVKVRAYDERADYCLRKLQKGDIIFVEGYLKIIDNVLNIIAYHIDINL